MPLLHALAQTVVSTASPETCDTQSLANLAWAFARLVCRDEPLLEVLARECLGQLSEFRPRGLVNIAWAFAAVHVASGPLLQGISTELQVKESECSVIDLSSMLWSFATLAMSASPSVNDMVAAISGRVQDFGAQSLSNTAWAFAVLDLEHRNLFDDLIAASVARSQEFPVQNIVNTVWACAQLVYQNQEFVSSMSSAAADKLHNFEDVSLVTMVWAFATLAVRDDPLVGPLEKATLAILRSGRSDWRDLCNLSWVLTELKWTSLAMKEALVFAAFQNLQKLKSSESAEAFSTEVRTIVRALATAGCLGSSDSDQPSEADKIGEGAFVQAQRLLQQVAARLDKDFSSPGELLLGPGDSDMEPAVLLETKDVLVLVKPPGWTVTVGPGSEDDWSPEVSGIESAEEEDEGLGSRKVKPLQAWVYENLGKVLPIARDWAAQYGLVHRLDRDTSGLLLCAKSYLGYHMAHLQFAAGRVIKEYVCLCHGHMQKEPRRIEIPLRVSGVRGAGFRVSTAEPGRGMRPASTEVLAVAHLIGHPYADDGQCGQHYSLVHVRLHSGRLHQIRAHMSLQGHPLVGDPAYGAPASKAPTRPFLHACHLVLDVGDGLLDARCQLLSDHRAILSMLSGIDEASAEMLASWLA